MQEQDTNIEQEKPIMTADERKLLGAKIDSMKAQGSSPESDEELRSLVAQYDKATTDLNALRAKEGLMAIDATYEKPVVASEGGVVLTPKEAAVPVSPDEAAEKAREANDLLARVR